MPALRSALSTDQLACPTTDHSTADVLAVLENTGRRAGETVPAAALLHSLKNQYQPGELADGLERMAADGYFDRTAHGDLIITEKACPPKSPDYVRAILNGLMRRRRMHAGDHIGASDLQMGAGVSLRASEAEAGWNAMVDEGLLDWNGRSFVLTEAGAAQLSQ